MTDQPDPPDQPVPPWRAYLADLLAGPGAELLVTDPGGKEVFRAPLARQYRLDADDPHVIWIRPVLGGYAPADPSSEHDFLFHLNTARRRGLHYLHAELRDGEILLHLLGGQRARIGPASEPARTQLWLWDQFLATALTTEQADQLAELREDSWIGPYA